MSRHKKSKVDPYPTAWDGYVPGTTPVLLIHYARAYNQNGAQVELGLFMFPIAKLLPEHARLYRIYKDDGCKKYSERPGHDVKESNAIRAALHSVITSARALDLPANIVDTVRIIDDSDLEADVCVEDVVHVPEPSDHPEPVDPEKEYF